MEAEMSTRQVSFRVTLLEEQAIREFCRIMDFTISQLVEMAAVETVHRMDCFDPQDVVGKPLHWIDKPLRGDGSVRTKLLVSFTPPHYDVVEAVATALPGTTVPLFLIGCTLRYIANKKKQVGRASPELSKLDLPDQYT
jgi:hypothetical protein